jgi:arsenite-transporting ATPase
MILVSRPERGALAEAARTSAELRELAIANQHVVINGVFTATDRHDRIAVALEQRGRDALRQIPSTLARLPISEVPLQPFNLVGVETVRRLFSDAAAPVENAVGALPPLLPYVPPLALLVDELENAERGLILVMGKGGVGKTTIAAAIAVELATRGHPVHLTTTDPAAHLTATIEGKVANLRISRIDPVVETRAYSERALATQGRNLTPAELELLKEDLKSPCTEEVAIFHAFSRVVSQARAEFVVVDTAPTGHTLLLLDTTGAYHHEVMRSLGNRPGVTSAVTPMMRLRDPAYTKMLLVTLPETTPVLEAAQLQDDLRRAQVEPFAWVINSSLAATGTDDPLLQQRAASELEQIAQVRDHHAERVFLVPWLADEPIGPERLRDLVAGHLAAAATSRGVL